jgi:hypothetical protein
MLNALIVTLFVVLRIGIPAAALLTIGEVLRRHNQGVGNLRGA